MKVRVKLHGETKRGITGIVGDVLETDLEPGETVGELLRRIGVRNEDIWMTAIDREVVKNDHVLVDGDNLEVIAPIAGGCAANHSRWLSSTS